MDLPGRWTSIVADLTIARNKLPDSAASHCTIQQYEEFINNNELELACDMLEECAKDYPVNMEFWTALHNAAAKMQLPDRATKYEKYSMIKAES